MKRILKTLFIDEFSWKRVVRAIILIPICVILGLRVIAVFFADKAIFRRPDSSYKDTADVIQLKTRHGDTISARFEENPKAS